VNGLRKLYKQMPQGQPEKEPLSEGDSELGESDVSITHPRVVTPQVPGPVRKRSDTVKFW
jgi:hypothetical protein